MGETVARNMQSKLKRINKTNFVANCWLLISLCDVIRIISVWNYCTNVSINLEFIAPLCQFWLATKGTEVLNECSGRIYTAVHGATGVHVSTVSMNFDP